MTPAEAIEWVVDLLLEDGWTKEQIMTAVEGAVDIMEAE